jgi:spore coat polysaccharide biosynthesis protein SpsF
MKTLAIIQARMGSSRLPGKVLERAGGRTLLAHIVGRAQRATGIDDVVVATTVLPGDDAIVDEAERLGVFTYRGSAPDVLDRYYKAAVAFDGDVIVRLTADCPLLDPTIVSLVIDRYRSDPPVDYASSGFMFPEGYGAEVFNADVLTTMWREATQPFEREHVTPFVVHHPERFRIGMVEPDVDASWCRVTVDEAADLQLVRHLVDHLEPLDPMFGCEMVVKYLSSHPEIAAINARYLRDRAARGG